MCESFPVAFSEGLLEQESYWIRRKRNIVQSWMILLFEMQPIMMLMLKVMLKVMLKMLMLKTLMLMLKMLKKLKVMQLKKTLVLKVMQLKKILVLKVKVTYQSGQKKLDLFHILLRERTQSILNLSLLIL
eukprot:gene24120-30429_t